VIVPEVEAIGCRQENCDLRCCFESQVSESMNGTEDTGNFLHFRCKHVLIDISSEFRYEIDDQKIKQLTSLSFLLLR
jgi:hypothetical protein